VILERVHHRVLLVGDLHFQQPGVEARPHTPARPITVPASIGSSHFYIGRATCRFRVYCIYILICYICFRNKVFRRLRVRCRFVSIIQNYLRSRSVSVGRSEVFVFAFIFLACRVAHAACHPRWVSYALHRTRHGAWGKRVRSTVNFIRAWYMYTTYLYVAVFINWFLSIKV
jgi:hypothetical protein